MRGSKGKVVFRIKPCGDTMVLRMNRKLNLGKVIKGISLDLKVKREGFSRGFRVVVSSILAMVVAYIVGSVFHLSALAIWLVLIALCVIVSTIVSLKPRLLLTVVCIMLLWIGAMFIVGSLFEELRSEITWDPGLLGSGTSLVALAIALYALLSQTGRKEDAINVSESGRGMYNLKEGYIWVEEIRKYRCEYCKHLGRYHYYKTLSGIKGHIAREHV